jgi:4-alpha-glucanotransferase
MTRQAGVLCPVSALPSRFGVGDFGASARHFADLLAQSGYRLWQILPLNPLGYGHSPYQPFSSFALEEIYVDLDELTSRGLIGDVPYFRIEEPKVEYEQIRAFKEPYLIAAYEAEMKKDPHCLSDFVCAHSWVRDWAYFMMNKRQEGMRSWEQWPKEKQDMIAMRPTLMGSALYSYNYEIWLQKTLYSQWNDLHRYVNAKGIRIIGDLPFYVGFDSCDLWGEQKAFLLDPKTKQPLWIAGVPPDYFSKTGQRWGNPIYDWDYLKKTDFAFILNRIKLNAGIYDIIRIDHFRAFDTFWKIPASCPTAVEGSWVEAPGYAFFDLLLRKCNSLELIAEDLGNLRPEVLVLRDHYSFPGMNVIEFTFHDAEMMHKSGYDRENMVAYLGTHDNDPLKGYFAKLPLDEQAAWELVLDSKKFPQGDINERLIRYELALKAKYAIFSLQDLLGLGSEARLNVPGVIDDVNWTWRLTSFASFENRIAHFKSLNAEYQR